jgi:hypothetical protein
MVADAFSVSRERLRFTSHEAMRRKGGETVTGAGTRVVEAKIFWEWLRGLDSNQDNQLQRLACYQLHYPGSTPESVADKGAKCFRRIRDAARCLMGWLQFVRLVNTQLSGEVSEWFKEHAWKACVGETQPWVRIPPSPPFPVVPLFPNPPRVITKTCSRSVAVRQFELRRV